MRFRLEFASFLNRFLLGSILVLGVLTFIGFFVQTAEVFDLANHFRTHYFFVLTVFSVHLIFRKHYLTASFAGFFALINLCFLIPFYVGGSSAYSGQSSYRVVAINLDLDNGKYQKVIQLIREAEPQFLVLQEFTDSWRKGLESALQAYPYSLQSDNSDGWGIGVYSHVPLVESKIQYFNKDIVPSAMVRVKVDDQILKLIGVHLRDPFYPGELMNRNGQLEDLAGMVKSKGDPVILVGDLNTTSWSPYFQKFIQQTGLVDSRLGRGVQGTWPSWLPFLTIPIDHALVSSEIQVINREVGPRVGSDHFPVILDFSLIS